MEQEYKDRQIWMDFGSTHEKLGRSMKNCRIQVERKGVRFSSSQILSVSHWKNLYLIVRIQPHTLHPSLLDQCFFCINTFLIPHIETFVKIFLSAAAYTGKRNSYLIFICGQFPLNFPFDPSPGRIPLVLFLWPYIPTDYLKQVNILWHRQKPKINTILSYYVTVLI